MSEPEINEDNCVLEKGNLKNLDDMFTYIGKYISPESKDYLNILYLKINKLNDLAKEKNNGILEKK